MNGIALSSVIEHRESPRLNLRLNVEFLKEGDERQVCRVGTTRNVSAGGIYFHTSEWDGISVGEDMAVRLSGLSGYGAGPLFRSLRVRARVLRLDPPDENHVPIEKAGIAAQFVEKPGFEVYGWSE